MERRGFFATVAGALGLAAANKLPAVAAEPEKKPEITTLLVSAVSTGATNMDGITIDLPHGWVMESNVIPVRRYIKR